MFKKILRKAVAVTAALVLLGSLGAAGTTAQAETKSSIKVLKIESKAVPGESFNVNVMLPPGYDAKQKYPVLYFLHWYGGTGDGIMNQTNLVANYEKFLNEKKVGKFIIVCPDSGAEGQSFLVNWAGQKNKSYEDYFVTEVMPLVEKTFSTLNTADARGITGFSAGGYGSYMISLRHPELFNSTSAFAGALCNPYRGVEDSSIEETMLKIFGNDVTKWRSYYPPSLLDNMGNDKPELLDVKTFYLICGTSDALLSSTQAMARELKNMGASYAEKYIPNGAHDFDFVMAALPDVLTFHWAQFSKAIDNTK